MGQQGAQRMSRGFGSLAKGSYLDIRFYLNTTPRQGRVQEAGCEKRDCARATTGEQGL